MNLHMSEGLFLLVGTNTGTIGVKLVCGERGASLGTIMGLKSSSQVGTQNKVTTVITDTVWSCIISAAADSLRAPTRPVSSFRSPPAPSNLSVLMKSVCKVVSCSL